MSEKFPTDNPDLENTSEKEEKTNISRREFLKKSLLGAGGIVSGAYGLKQALESQKNSEAREKLEELMQKSFYEDYAKEFSGSYGDRLYANPILIDQSFSPTVPDKNYFKLTPKIRALHYFLRNGRVQTFTTAEKLGCQYHQTILDNSHPLENIFEDAGIDIEGERIDWLEVPDGRSGEMYREGSRYGGETESVMVVEAYTDKLDDWAMLPAQKAGYEVDARSEFQGAVANEMSHEIQHKYFPSLFLGDDYERLDEPFKSFTTEVQDLRFKHNAQAAEFLSDVSNWVVSGKNGVYFRFFNPLFYMDPNSDYYQKAKIKPENDNYWYSYQVQKYAMEQVLNQKGYQNPSVIVEGLIQEAKKSDYKNHDDLFVSARKYFTEDDFEKVAEIYRRIGVELLKMMKPYFSKLKEK